MRFFIISENLMYYICNLWRKEEHPHEKQAHVACYYVLSTHTLWPLCFGQTCHILSRWFFIFQNKSPLIYGLRPIQKLITWWKRTDGKLRWSMRYNYSHQVINTCFSLVAILVSLRDLNVKTKKYSFFFPAFNHSFGGQKLKP